MSKGKEIPFEVAYPKAVELLEALRSNGAVETAEIAGSLRRKRPIVRDIDLVVSLKDFNEETRQIQSGFFDGIPFQIYQCPPHEFPFQLLMWTGSKEFNITIRRRAKAKLLSLSQHGFKKGDGSLLPFDQFQTEDDIFKFFEMYTVIPELRG